MPLSLEPVSVYPATTNIYPATFPENEGAQSIQPVAAVKNMDPNFDPAHVPHDQLIVGRKPRTLSTIEWLAESLKSGFFIVIRTFKISGLIISVLWNRGSVESLQKAAASAQGGIFIKAIQFVCSSPDMAGRISKEDPDKFLDALSHVTTSNKPMSLSELEHCLKQAGIPYDPSKLGERVNLGTGSIGEVNEIIMQGGGRQVIKVISPSSEIRVYSDLKVLRFILGIISFFRPSVLGTGTKNAINTFFDSIKDELNLIKEAQNTQKQQYVFWAINPNNPNRQIYGIEQNELDSCAGVLPTKGISGMMFRKEDTGQVVRIPINFKAPNVSGEYTTQRTLSMDKIHGVSLSEKDQGKLRDIIVQLVYQLFGSDIDVSWITDDHLQIFRWYLKNLAFKHWAYCYTQTGFFNADMHDGNIMIAAENGQLCIYFLDFGNTQRVSRETVKATYTILGAMEKLNDATDENQKERYVDVVINNLQIMGDYKPEKANWVKLKKDIKALMTGGHAERIGQKVLDVFDLAYQCNVKVPKEIVGLFRAMILIRSQNSLTLTEEDALARFRTSLENRNQTPLVSMGDNPASIPPTNPQAFPFQMAPYHCGEGEPVYIPPQVAVLV